jgi:hypothetical protein
MKVAADLGRRKEGRRRAAERLLAQLRLTPREAERGVDGRLVGTAALRIVSEARGM